MDNIAHTLLGAAIGRTVADRRVPAPVVLGMIAANAPDWLELVIGGRGRGADFLFEHRGITHSFLGAGLEIAAFTALTALWIGWRRRKQAVAEPLPWGPLVLLFATTVLSHLWLDWQGSFGLRPFLPWSQRRYYGDWVAIVDPMFWFVPIVALAWGGRRHWKPALGWLALTLPLLALVLIAPQATSWLRVASLAVVAVGVVGWQRHWFAPVASRWAAALAVLVLLAYAGAQGVGAQLARGAARRAAVARFGPDARAVVLTEPGHPFAWQALIGDSDSVAGAGWAIPRNLDLPVVRRAIATRPGQEIAGFARFLVARVDSSGPHPVVDLSDARNPRNGRGRWGVRVPIE